MFDGGGGRCSGCRSGPRDAWSGRVIRLVRDGHGKRCFGRIKNATGVINLKADVCLEKSVSFLILRRGKLVGRVTQLLVIVGGTNYVMEGSISDL